MMFPEQAVVGKLSLRFQANDIVIEDCKFHVRVTSDVFCPVLS